MWHREIETEIGRKRVARVQEEIAENQYDRWDDMWTSVGST